MTVDRLRPDDEMLRGVAAGLAPELLEDARRAAYERARGILVDRLTAALLDAAAGAAGPPVAPRNAVPAPPADAAGPRETVVVLHAVAEAGHADGLTNLDGSGPVSTVSDEKLDVVYSVVDRELFDGIDAEEILPTSRIAVLAQRHDDIVCALFARGPVLPVRLGTALPTVKAARELLDTRRQLFASELERLRSTAEWRCKVHVDERERDERRAVAPTSRPDAPQVESGTTYLARRAAELRAREEAGAHTRARLDGVAAALAAHAQAVSPVPAATSSTLFSGAFLVADDDAEGFRATAVATARALAAEGMSLTLTGPFPPYRFATALEDDA